MSISGSATEESSSTCMFHMLAESVVGMKFSVKNQTEGFSLSVSHEASGIWNIKFYAIILATA
jgi:hypothetical protein